MMREICQGWAYEACTFAASWCVYTEAGETFWSIHQLCTMHMWAAFQHIDTETTTISLRCVVPIVDQQALVTRMWNPVPRRPDR
jgi:uncharacterized protein YraI